MLCTPNNPTGPALQHQQVINFIDSVPDHIMIILDEAYVEFVTDPQGCTVWTRWSDDPMSWCCGPSPRRTGLPGFASATAWPMLTLPLPCAPCRPFGVSVAAQAAVIASLEESLLLDRVADLVKARTPWPSACGISAESAGRSKQLRGCPAVHGPRRTQRPLPVPVAVRPYASGGDWDGLRITVGEPAANTRVLEVVRATLDRLASDRNRAGTRILRARSVIQMTPAPVRPR